MFFWSALIFQRKAQYTVASSRGRTLNTWKWPGGVTPVGNSLVDLVDWSISWRKVDPKWVLKSLQVAQTPFRDCNLEIKVYHFGKSYQRQNPKDKLRHQPQMPYPDIQQNKGINSGEFQVNYSEWKSTITGQNFNIQKLLKWFCEAKRQTCVSDKSIG